jgi:hypothetical protein
MADLLKKGGNQRYPDDEWRNILEANGFHPSGAVEEVWRSPYSDIKVKIDVDREVGEPYYQIIDEGGLRGVKQSDSEVLKGFVEPKEPEPMSTEEAAKYDDQFMKDLKIVGSQRTESKFAGRPPRFSFAVPMQAAGVVAFHLTKAGLKDFEVTHYKEDDFSIFEFPTEPEMHVGEEIIKAEFADQISARKGLWGQWAEQPRDPTEIRGEHENEKHQYVASYEKLVYLARQAGKVAGQWGDRSYDSDQVHDVLDKYRRTGANTEGFDEPLPEGVETDVLKSMENAEPETYLGVVVWMVSHGDTVPQVYRERARQIAFALVQDERYLASWKDPASRKAELEEEIELLEGPDKIASYLGRKRASDEYQIDGHYRRNPIS